MARPSRLGLAVVLLASILPAGAFAARPPADSTPPAVTLVTPAAGSSSDDATPLYSGAAGSLKTDQPTVTVRVYSGNAASGTAIQTLSASRSGSSWSITPTSALAAGTYTARAEQRDKAKNVGFSSANTFTVTAAPVTDPVIAAAGDIACDPVDGSYNGGLGTSTACRQLATSNLLVGSGLSRVLTLGDNQYENGALTKFQASYDPTWGRVRSITSPAIGNHEYGTAGAAGYFDYFGSAAGARGEGWYSHDVGAWHLIALNSNCSIVSCAAGSAQETWLRADLAAHPAACTLAYFHHPRFSSGEHGDNTAVVPLWQALYDANADVILSGHDHDYERFAPQTPLGLFDATRGIREFVVGTGGKTHYATPIAKPNSETRNSDTYGVLRLTLHAAGYDWQFVPAVGSYTDAGSGDCH